MVYKLNWEFCAFKNGDMALGWGHQEWPQTSFTKCALKNYCVPGSATTMNKMNEFSALTEPIGATRSKVHIHYFNTHGGSVGIKSNCVGQTPAIDSVGNTFIFLQSSSGWREVASEEQRGSQWDHCAGGIGEMVRAQSRRALKAMEGVQILFTMQWKVMRGLCRGMIAF